MLQRNRIVQATCLLFAANGAVFMIPALAAGDWVPVTHGMLWLILAGSWWEMAKQMDATAAALAQARKAVEIAQELMAREEVRQVCGQVGEAIRAELERIASERPGDLAK